MQNKTPASAPRYPAVCCHFSCAVCSDCTDPQWALEKAPGAESCARSGRAAAGSQEGLLGEEH